jgi:hypothetical protein
MRIKAYVSMSTGKTKHYISNSIDQNFENNDIENIPVPKWVEISEESEGFYLYHYNSDGECIADTWHESIEDAKEQAKFEFGILNDDWKPMENNSR